MKPRLVELDLAKGLAIFLVVLAHLVSSSASAPAGNEWYATLTRLVYMFHMPFFMFVSGAVFFHTLPEIRSLGDYGRYLQKRALRLLPAFFLFSLIIWAAKELAQGHLHVDNVRTGGLTALQQIALRPGESIARSLWYIYVLFQYCVVFPVLLIVLRGNRVAMLLAVAALHIVGQVQPLTTFLAINQTFEYAMYFGLGALLIDHYPRVLDGIKQNTLVIFSLFLVAFLSMQFAAHATAKSVIGLASLPAVLGIAASTGGRNDRRLLQLLGEYTFTIYLLNTIFIGLAKAVLMMVVPWDGHWFLLYFPVLLAAGLIGPIATYRYVFSRVPALARMTK